MGSREGGSTWGLEGLEGRVGEKGQWLCSLKQVETRSSEGVLGAENGCLVPKQSPWCGHKGGINEAIDSNVITAGLLTPWESLLPEAPTSVSEPPDTPGDGFWDVQLPT